MQTAAFRGRDLFVFTLVLVSIFKCWYEPVNYDYKLEPTWFVEYQNPDNPSTDDFHVIPPIVFDINQDGKNEVIMVDPHHHLKAYSFGEIPTALSHLYHPEEILSVPIDTKHGKPIAMTTGIYSSTTNNPNPPQEEDSYGQILLLLDDLTLLSYSHNGTLQYKIPVLDPDAHLHYSFDHCPISVQLLHDYAFVSMERGFDYVIFVLLTVINPMTATDTKSVLGDFYCPPPVSVHAFTAKEGMRLWEYSSLVNEEESLPGATTSTTSATTSTTTSGGAPPPPTINLLEFPPTPFTSTLVAHLHATAPYGMSESGGVSGGSGGVSGGKKKTLRRYRHHLDWHHLSVDTIGRIFPHHWLSYPDDRVQLHYLSPHTPPGRRGSGSSSGNTGNGNTGNGGSNTGNSNTGNGSGNTGSGNGNTGSDSGNTGRRKASSSSSSQGEVGLEAKRRHVQQARFPTIPITGTITGISTTTGEGGVGSGNTGKGDTGSGNGNSGSGNTGNGNGNGNTGSQIGNILVLHHRTGITILSASTGHLLTTIPLDSGVYYQDINQDHLLDALYFTHYQSVTVDGKIDYTGNGNGISGNGNNGNTGTGGGNTGNGNGNTGSGGGNTGISGNGNTGMCDMVMLSGLPPQSVLFSAQGFCDPKNHFVGKGRRQHHQHRHAHTGNSHTGNTMHGIDEEVITGNTGSGYGNTGNGEGAGVLSRAWLRPHPVPRSLPRTPPSTPSSTTSGGRKRTEEVVVVLHSTTGTVTGYTGKGKVVWQLSNPHKYGWQGQLLGEEGAAGAAGVERIQSYPTWDLPVSLDGNAGPGGGPGGGPGVLLLTSDSMMTLLDVQTGKVLSSSDIPQTHEQVIRPRPRTSPDTPRSGNDTAGAVLAAGLQGGKVSGLLSGVQSGVMSEVGEQVGHPQTLSQTPSRTLSQTLSQTPTRTSSRTLSQTPSQILYGPWLADFDDDGVLDVLLLTPTVILGYRVEILPSYYPLVVPFLVILLVAVLLFFSKLHFASTSSSTSGGGSGTGGGGKNAAVVAWGKWMSTRSTDNMHLD